MHDPFLALINIILGCQFLYQLAVIIERKSKFYQATHKNYLFLKELNRRLSNFSHSEIKLLSTNYSTNALAQMIEDGLEHLPAYQSHDLTFAQIELAKLAMQRSRISQLAKLREHLSSLLCIGITAPMISLIGLIYSFNEFMNFKGDGEYAPYAEFMYWLIRSLPPLAFALIISISAMAFYFYLKKSYEAIVVDMEKVELKFIASLWKRF
jgi:biopolymer transport protein ExbB/TolQ